MRDENLNIKNSSDMKMFVVHKFYSKRAQKGVVFLFTIILILIIAILNIAFFYIQFLEVDLIAHETSSLQAFYLAHAGLSRGMLEISENLDNIIEDLRNDPDAFRSPFRPLPEILDPNTNIYGSHDYEFILDNSLAHDDRIIINGIGEVNNIKRIVQRTFELPEGLPNEFAERVVRALDETTTSLERPNFEDLKYFTPCIPESKTKILTGISPSDQLIEQYNAKQVNLKQQLAIDEFKRQIYRGIKTIQDIDKNNNELLFFRNDIIAQNYDSPYMDEIDSSQYGNMWKYPEFDYREYRTSQRGRTIISPFMTVKSGPPISLEKGRYFFESLTLKEGSSLTTKDDVEIYVVALKLEKGAKLIGNEKRPNSLLILADYWENIPYDSSIHRINIGPSCEVYGHIFAPRIEVFISTGSDKLRRNTTVQGFILTKRLVIHAEEGQYFSVIHCPDVEISDEIPEIAGSWREVWNP